MVRDICRTKRRYQSVVIERMTISAGRGQSMNVLYYIGWSRSGLEGRMCG